MVNIYDLLKQEKELVEKSQKLRTELVEEYRLRKLDEGNAWNMDFKAIGATTDKLRAAAVQRVMNQHPNIYAQKKAKFDNIEKEIKFIREAISVMKQFEVEEIDLGGEQDTDEGTSDSVSGEPDKST